MKKYQKPTFEAIQYDVEEILTTSGMVIGSEGDPKENDFTFGQVWG